MKNKRLHLFLQALAITGSLIPLVALVLAYFSNNLTANPVQAAEQRTGDAAVVILLLSLACRPAAQISGRGEILQLRKPLGLFAFFYALLHVLIYSGLDYGWDWTLIWPEVRTKPFILAGLAALIILLALAITSLRWWKIRLGGHWRSVHALVYPAAGLAILHFILVSKGDILRLSGDVGKPLIFFGVFVVLMGLRVPVVRGRLRPREGEEVEPGRHEGRGAGRRGVEK